MSNVKAVQTSDKQAEMLLKRFATHPDPISKFDLNDHHTSALVLYEKEDGTVGTRIDVYEQFKLRNNQGYESQFRKYQINDEQIHKFFESEPELMSDIFSKFGRNRAMRVACLKDGEVAGWEEPRQNDITKALESAGNGTDIFRSLEPAVRNAIAKSDLNSSYGINRPDSFRIHYNMEKCELPEGKWIPVSEGTDTAYVRAYTGISPEDGYYKQAYLFTPQVACDCMSPPSKRQTRNLICNPYIINRYGARTDDNLGAHSIYMSPEDVLDLIKVSNFDTKVDGQVVKNEYKPGCDSFSGVVTQSVINTKGSEKNRVFAADIRNLYTRDDIADRFRTISREKVISNPSSSYKVNFEYDVDDPNKASSQPPFDEKAHKVYLGVTNRIRRTMDCAENMNHVDDIFEDLPFDNF